jgi:hypothetical protein
MINQRLIATFCFELQVNAEHLISYHVSHELPVLLLSLKIEREMLDQYSELRLECRAALFETVANFQTRLNVHVHQPHLPVQPPFNSPDTHSSSSSSSSSPSSHSNANQRNRFNRRQKKLNNANYRLNLFNQLDYEQSAENKLLFDLDDDFERFNRNEISALRNGHDRRRPSNPISALIFFTIAILAIFL